MARSDAELEAICASTQRLADRRLRDSLAPYEDVDAAFDDVSGWLSR